MTKYYPSNLPPPLKAGKTRKIAPSFRASEAYRGRVYTQPIGTDVPVFWDLTFRFTQEQAQAFMLWFSVELNSGATPFVMPIRTEYGPILYQLQMLPDGLMDTSEDGPHFTYRVNVMAKKMTIPDEFISRKDEIIFGDDHRSIVLSEITAVI